VIGRAFKASNQVEGESLPAIPSTSMYAARSRSTASALGSPSRRPPAEVTIALAIGKLMADR
jgi:hypothetical protein